jgi:hypothetical protein
MVVFHNHHRACASTAWAASEWWVCSKIVVRRLPVMPLVLDLKMLAPPCVAPRTCPTLDFGSASYGGWWMARGGALDQGKPLAG